MGRMRTDEEVSRDLRDCAEKLREGHVQLADLKELARAVRIRYAHTAHTTPELLAAEHAAGAMHVTLRFMSDLQGILARKASAIERDAHLEELKAAGLPTCDHLMPVEGCCAIETGT